MREATAAVIGLSLMACATPAPTTPSVDPNIARFCEGRSEADCQRALRGDPIILEVERRFLAAAREYDEVEAVYRAAQADIDTIDRTMGAKVAALDALNLKPRLLPTERAERDNLENDVRALQYQRQQVYAFIAQTDLQWRDARAEYLAMSAQYRDILLLLGQVEQLQLVDGEVSRVRKLEFSIPARGPGADR